MANCFVGVNISGNNYYLNHKTFPSVYVQRYIDIWYWYVWYHRLAIHIK